MLRGAKKRHFEIKDTSRRTESQKNADDTDSTEAKQHVLGSQTKSKKRKESSEVFLEKLVFGNDIEDASIDSDEDEAIILEDEQDEDNVTSDEDSDQDSSGVESRLQGSSDVLSKDEKKPVWHDDTDEAQLRFDQEKSYRQGKIKRKSEKEVSGKQLQQRLKSQYEKVVGSTPSWAKLKSERDEEDIDSDESDDEEGNPLVRSTGDYLTTSEQLPSETINIKRLSNLNKEQQTQGKVTALQFHPGAQVAMVAGLDQRLNLFQVEGRHNPKIQSVFVEEFPIHCARFSSQGSEVILSGLRKFFYAYDMIAGKMTQVPYIRGINEKKLKRFEVSPDGRFLAFLGDYGNIHLLSAQTKELISTLKMNGSVNAVTFTQDGSKMMSFGDDCDVYVWDLNTRDCTHKFADEGCIKGNTIAVSHGNQYVATGSQSGVINIYNDQCFTKTHPTPLRAVMNLTTPVTAAKFNSSSDILAAISVYSKDVVKLVHLPTCHTFANFPSSTDILQSPCVLDFSPRSGYFALGNNRGDVPLFRLKHFTEY